MPELLLQLEMLSDFGNYVYKKIVTQGLLLLSFIFLISLALTHPLPLSPLPLPNRHLWKTPSYKNAMNFKEPTGWNFGRLPFYKNLFSLEFEIGSYSGINSGIIAFKTLKSFTQCLVLLLYWKAYKRALSCWLVSMSTLMLRSIFSTKHCRTSRNFNTVRINSGKWMSTILNSSKLF